MDIMIVEPIRSKFTAYHYDGSETAAKETVEKWECCMQKNENFENKYVLTFPSGKQCFPNSYIVLENKEPTPYTQDEFIKTYQVVYSSSDRIGSFYSMD